MEIVIRRAESSDLFNLAVLKQQVWISTYATEGLTDVFSGYVLSEYSIENVSKSITDKNRLILIAAINECVIGCAEILLSPQSPLASEALCLEISTLYVLERFQGFGIGKKLLAECENATKQRGYNNVWLTVFYNNIKAIDFYRRQNFIQIGATDFVLGKNKHKNYIMMKVLS